MVSSWTPDPDRDFRTNTPTRNSHGLTIAPTAGPEAPSTIFSSSAARNHYGMSDSLNSPLNPVDPDGNAIAISQNSPHIAAGNAGDITYEELANSSITVMFGPSHAPDQNIMPASMVSKLPKKVVDAMKRSKNKKASRLVQQSCVLYFTAPYWHENLKKVYQYLNNGDYEPWNPQTPLEVLDKDGKKNVWAPWMRHASDIDEASTTEETYQFFAGELHLYKWACFSHYDELKTRSFKRLRSDFPILGREAFALVDFIRETTGRLPLEDHMKQLAEDAVRRNKKQVALQPSFTSVLEEAIGGNFIARLLEEAQRDRLASLESERSLDDGLGTDTGTSSRQPTLASGMWLSSQLLEQYINSGRLFKARRDGYGTLLPAAHNGLGRQVRNENFRFRMGELLIHDPNCRTFNPPNNVVVENMHGERGDMLKEMLDPLDLKLPNRNEPVTPTETKATLQSGKSHKRLKSEYPCSDSSEEDRRARRADRFQTGPRSLDTAKRRRRSRTRSPGHKPDCYSGVYGRR